MKRLGIFLASVGLLVSACGEPVTSGHVETLENQPAHIVIDKQPVYIPMCRYDPALKMTTCPQQLIGYNDVERYVPECWYVMIKNDKGKTRDFCVSEQEFNTLSPGDWYVIN